MTFRQIEIFMEVAKTGSVTRSAKNLYISQPAISRAIFEIESEYSTRLFDRINKKMYLTADGNRLLDYVIQITNLMDTMDKDMKKASHNDNVRIGASKIVSDTVLMPLLALYTEKYPDAKYEVTIANVPAIKEALIKNTVDVAIIEDMIENENFVNEILFKDEILPVCSPKHQFSGKKITPEQMQNRKIIIREPASISSQMAYTIAMINNIKIKPVIETMGNTSLLMAVENNLGVAFVPHNVAKEKIDQGKLSVFSIGKENMFLTCRLIYHKQKSLSQSIINFVNFCIEKEQR